MIIDKKDSAALKEFIAKWTTLAEIDTEKAFDLATKALKYYGGDAKAREQLRHFQQLEQKWYTSLDKGEPEFSVYDDEYILSDLWACWVRYSRKYLIELSRNSEFKNLKPRSIADLGCGIGYTTVALKELFPAAAVFGTNLAGGIQWKFASALGAEHGFKMLDSIEGVAVDLIFASEYFEHIENAVEHLEHIVKVARPEALIIANSFGTTSIGHFVEYKSKGSSYTGKATSRQFNDLLRDSGYRSVETGFWNDRPRFWRKNS